MANASQFQCGEFYGNEYEDHKSFRSDDFDNRSRLTSNRKESNSKYGPESHAPSRNMLQNIDKEGLITKEALAGEIMENESTKVVKETLARRRWVLLCWLLPWWIPSIFLKWFGRMKRQDIRQSQFLDLSSVRRSTSSVHRSLHHIPIRTRQTTSTLQFVARCLTSHKSRRRIPVHLMNERFDETNMPRQGMFQLWEINQMEREMCQYLEWELNANPITLREFEDMIRKNFVGPVPTLHISCH